MSARIGWPAIVREAIAPFFDATLQDLFEQARREWLEEAQEIVDEGLDGDREQIMAVARDKLSQVRALIGQVSESLQTSAEPDDLPEFEPPDPVVPAGDALPSGLGTTLVSSGWGFADQCRALKRSKSYSGIDGIGEDDEEAERS